MTTKRIDRILLGLGALLILISSCQLFFIGSGNSDGLKLGTLTSTLSVVKTKSALALDWRDASSGNDLTENQLIYTDNESSAEVKFLEGNSLEIGENSLVKLKALGKEQGMDLSKGFIRAKLEGNKPLKVQMNGEDYLVSGKDADIQINIQDEKSEIGVLTGEIKIEGGGISESLNPQTALAITDGKVEKKSIYFQTLTPSKNSIQYITGSESDIQFTWEPGDNSSVILSRKASLANSRTFSGDSGMSVTLGSGLWYFRIENEKGTSLVSSFRIVQEKPLQILRPLNGETITLLDENNQNVVLQWKNELNDQVLVEWNDGELHSLAAEGTTATVPVQSGKPFSWRIKIDNPERPLAKWSEWQVVTINLSPRPKVPTDLIPHEVEYQTYETPNEKVELNWKGNGPFELEIKSPAAPEFLQKVPSTFWQYVAKEAGTYLWRVRSVDSFLRNSEWSEWRTFTIQDLSNEKASSTVQRIQLKKPDQSVTFNWEAESGTTSVFELAKDQKFNQIVKKIEVTKDSTQVNIPTVGEYYWRSRQFRPDGTIDVSRPKKVIIEPTPAPSKPEKLPDLEVPMLELPTTTFMERIFNFIIPSAHADEIKGIVRLSLPVKEEAKAYVVRIYRDKGLKDLVLEEQLQNKELVWKSAEPGTFYWQYAVVDYWDRKSLFSDPSVLTVTYEEVGLPEKPKLLSPIRATEVEQKNLELKWTSSATHSSYKVEISEKDDFKKIISEKKVNEPKASFTELKLRNKLHFWRITAFNKRGKEVVSNTGRFFIIPPKEKILIQDLPKNEFKKTWNRRAFISWNPSMDSYTFKDGSTGKIDGTVMNGLGLSGTQFLEKYIFNGEILRQSGEVFEGESYLFQRITLDGIKTLYQDNKHVHGIGIVIGQTSGNGYTITNNQVSGSSVSGLSYGVVFRNYFAWNELWEMQGKIHYLLGDIPQLEFGADAIRKYKSYLILGGLSYASRDYEESSGKQTSIRFSFGIGKEF